jgi:hypothetical protein
MSCRAVVHGCGARELGGVWAGDRIAGHASGARVTCHALRTATHAVTPVASERGQTSPQARTAPQHISQLDRTDEITSE